MHSQHGNGGGKGGKSGKGNSKNQFVPERDPELEYKQQIKDAMPTAARLRVQPRLVQAEWDAPIQHWQHLTAPGGVAICPRDALPQTLNNVGYTAHPCAVVLTQSPEDLHLRGYPRSKIRCTFDICTDEGDRQQVIVDRYLVQLGFSQHVHMLPTGDTLSFPPPQSRKLWPNVPLIMDGQLGKTLQLSFQTFWKGSSLVKRSRTSSVAMAATHSCATKPSAKQY